MTRKLEWIGVVLLAWGASCAPTEFAPRAKVEIEAEVMVDPVESGLERSMLGMVTHPDGSIYLNTQTQQRLYKSTDQGRSWTRLPVNLPEAPPDQVQHGLFVSRDGRLWLMHQSPGGKDLFVSVSNDSGSTWKTTSIDFGQFSPGGSEDPYILCANDYNTFFQEADGTVALGVGLRYADHRDYHQADRSRPGFHETLIRKRDGEASWSDPTEVHQHVAETGYAVDPDDSMRVLAMTRIQRPPFPGEDVAAMSKRSGAPPGATAIYKQGILLESSDGGRTFQEVPGSLNEYYGHRGTILWTPGNVVVITHQGGVPGKSAPRRHAAGSDQPGRGTDLVGRNRVGNTLHGPLHPLPAGAPSSRPLLYGSDGGTGAGPLPDRLQHAASGLGEPGRQRRLLAPGPVVGEMNGEPGNEP